MGDKVQKVQVIYRKRKGIVRGKAPVANHRI